MSSINEDTSDIRVLADKAQKRLSAVVVETAKRLSAVINNVITPSDSDDLYASESVTDDQDFLKRTKGCPCWSKVAAVAGGTVVIGGGTVLANVAAGDPEVVVVANQVPGEEFSDQNPNVAVVSTSNHEILNTNYGINTNINTENSTGLANFISEPVLEDNTSTNISPQNLLHNNGQQGLYNQIEGLPGGQNINENNAGQSTMLSELETAMDVEQSSFGPTTRDEFLEYVKNEKQIAAQCPAKLMEFVETCNANPACRSKVGTLDVDKDSCFNHTNVRGVSSWIAVNFHELDGSDHRDFITMLEPDEDSDTEKYLRFNVFGKMRLQFEREGSCPHGACGGKSCGVTYHFRNVSCKYLGNRTKIFKYSPGGVLVEQRYTMDAKNDLPIFATQGINKQYEELKMYVRKAKGLFEAEEV